MVARSGVAFDVDTSKATLAVTAGLEAGREVNLEKSLRLADRIDGHMVSGHVDGVGTVTAFDDLGGSARLEIEAPRELARYIARKGSIAIVGSRAGRNLAGRLEAMGRTGQLDGAASALANLRETLEQLNRAFVASGLVPRGRRPTRAARVPRATARKRASHGQNPRRRR